MTTSSPASAPTSMSTTLPAKAATHPKKAYKILTRPQYTTLNTTSTFTGSPIDLADGYIHLSSSSTALDTYVKYFAPAVLGDDDLVVLEVDLNAVERAGKPVKWEPARNGTLFPHVYGVLSVSDVVRMWEGRRWEGSCLRG